ncbi:MAG: endonuclease [Candidatus Enteromonas sp.]|nr:endonuclease [Candidatus Enteromonas sp.]
MKMQSTGKFPCLFVLGAFLLGSCGGTSSVTSEEESLESTLSDSVPSLSTDESSSLEENSSPVLGESSSSSEETGKSYRIEFGETKYTGSSVFDSKCYESEIEVSVHGSNCYSGGVGSAVRIGSGNKSGSMSFTFSTPIQAIEVYSFVYSSPYSLILTWGGNELTSPVLEETVPSSSPTYSTSFGIPVSSFSLSGSIRFCLSSLTVYVGGSLPETSTPETSSSEVLDSTTESESSSVSSSTSTTLPSSSDEYYQGINWSLKGANLKTALCERISKGYQSKGYDFAYEAYSSTDTDEEGKIVDMYSAYRYSPTADHQGAPGKGNYSKEGQMFNREHTIPQSVFSERAPMKSDLHHLLPTDAYVNNRRSNFPHGYVGSNVSYKSTNGTTVGTGDSQKNRGYSGSCCEVIDEYKGDIARIYFYFVTRYQSELPGWKSYASFDGKAYPSLSSWAIETYLEWNDLDPISDRERERNDAVFAYQKNRNPFVDVPGLAHQIWDV